MAARVAPSRSPRDAAWCWAGMQPVARRRYSGVQLAAVQGCISVLGRDARPPQPSQDRAETPSALPAGPAALPDRAPVPWTTAGSALELRVRSNFPHVVAPVLGAQLRGMFRVM